MKLNSFLAVKSLVSVLFGIAFLAVPDWSMSLFGVTLDPSGALMTRYLGAALIGVALLCLLTGRAPASALQRDVVLSLFVFDTLGFILALVGQLSAVFNALGWVIVVIWLLLAAGLGYFRFLKTEPLPA